MKPMGLWMNGRVCYNLGLGLGVILISHSINPKAIEANNEKRPSRKHATPENARPHSPKRSGQMRTDEATMEERDRILRKIANVTTDTMSEIPRSPDVFSEWHGCEYCCHL